MLTIKILGSGCENCQRLAATARQVVSQLALEARVVKVTEFSEIAKYHLLATPGLVINEKVVSAGRVPSEAEVTTFITTALEQSEAGLA